MFVLHLRGATERTASSVMRNSMLSVMLQVAVVTSVIIAVTLGAGVWLDRTLGTRPLLTVGMLVVSIPLTLIALYLLAANFARRSQAGRQPVKNTLEEDGVDGFKSQ
ncbi:MAG: AtpZ/AtpI family protein [Chloroflexi bacterium]|nr:MAG: AtpZ/AtpI family protein [Chloroflexota bacterium]